MHEHDKHVASIVLWKGPVIATVVALVVTIAVLVLLTQMVTDTPKAAKDDEAAVLARIKPVGDVRLAIAGGPKGQLSGEQVFNQACKTCHEGGLAGAPKVGDKAAWGKVIAQGLAPTVDHAVKGIRAMPPKGGNPDFENIEIERAVVFMANMASANWKEPAAPAAAPSVSAASPAPALAAAVGKSDGKKIYDATCTVCHAAGVAGAPKFGDKAAWAPRLKTGIDALYGSAIQGKSAMPAKGGNTSLSDADVKAAVDYIAAAGK